MRVPTFGRNLDTRKRLKRTALLIKGKRIASCRTAHSAMLRHDVADLPGAFSRSVQPFISHEEDNKLSSVLDNRNHTVQQQQTSSQRPSRTTPPTEGTQGLRRCRACDGQRPRARSFALEVLSDRCSTPERPRSDGSAVTRRRAMGGPACARK